MKTKLFFLAILFAGFASLPASAQVRQRENHEKERIEQGRKNGELTRRESRRFAQEQKHIRHDIRRSKNNDGHIGPRERKHISREENRASRDIYRSKHNNRILF